MLPRANRPGNGPAFVRCSLDIQQPDVGSVSSGTMLARLALPRALRRVPRRAIPPLLLLALVGPGLAGSGGAAAADGDAAQRRNQVVATVERVKPAVVSIRTTQQVARPWFDMDGVVLREERDEVEGSLGSGVLFHPAGFVITNAHVIARASSLFVELNSPQGSVSRRAAPFAVDMTNDLAILRILPREGAEQAEIFPYLELGTSSDLMLGETVIAVGNPFKLGLSVSTGIVAGVNRTLNLGKRTFSDFVQVTAAVNPGNSGGALFDVTGRWIGVTTAIYNRVSGAEGIAFAIPSDRVRRLVGQAFRRRVLADDWLGLEEVEGPAGVAQVKAVFPRGPAAASGLKAGDVLAQVNGVATPTLFDYAMATLNLPRGSVARLGVVREGRALPEPFLIQLSPVPTDELALKHLGFSVADVPDYQGGVVVKSVRAGGPAAKVGLRVGDVVLALGTWRIRHTDDLLVFVQMVGPGDLVDLLAQRPLPDGTLRSPRGLNGRLTAE